MRYVPEPKVQADSSDLGLKPWLQLRRLGESEWRPIETHALQGSITGVLPAGVEDNSGWADVQIRYSRGEEEGMGFLRWNIDRISRGQAQIRALLSPPSGASYVRIRLKARSEQARPFTFGIRQVEKPFAFLWSKRISLGTTWENLSFVVVLPKPEDPIGLWAFSDLPNQIDIAELELETLPLSKSSVSSSSRSDSRPENLLRSSRYPLGLPAGANADPETSLGTDLIVMPDSAHPGVGGWPSLKLATPPPSDLPSYRWGKAFVVGEPFGIRSPGSPHTLSFSAMGDGSVVLQLIENGNGKAVASREFPVSSAQWQRNSLTWDQFKPGVPYQLKFIPTGTIWIDAVQLSPGTAGDYLSLSRPEVALQSLPLSHVYLEGEDAAIRYQVTGPVEGLVLRAKVVDLYGEQFSLGDIPLDNSRLQGKLPFNVFPGRPFGAFRVEAWLVDKEGRPQSPYYETAILRVRPPRHEGEDGPNSPFGVHVEPDPAQLEMAKRIGINWVRLHDPGLRFLGWYFLEPTPGVWHFYDAPIQRYRQAHLTILGELGTAPAWATNLAKIGPHDPYFDRFYQPNRLDEFSRYVETVVARYRGSISHWDVWNEPWNYRWWAVSYNPDREGIAAYQTSREPERDYVSLCKAAHDAVKKIDPAATVLGIDTSGFPSTTHGSGGNEWTTKVVEAGGLAGADAISYHHYPDGMCLFPGDIVEKGFNIATGSIPRDQGKLPVPVWMTEGSSVTGMTGNGFYNHSLPFSSPEDFDEVGDRLCRFVISLLAQGVGKVFLYTMDSYRYFGGDNRWRVLTAGDGTPHPSAAAFAAMAYQIEGATYARRVDLGESLPVYLFARKNQTVAVFAPHPGEAPGRSIPLISGMAYYDLYGNPLALGNAKSSIYLVYGISDEAPEVVAKRLAP